MTRIFPRHVAVVAVAFLAAACSTDKLLEVETPDIITPDKVNNVGGAEALRARAIGSFATLLNGNLGIATTGALMSDELASGRTQLDWLDNRTYDETQDINFSQFSQARNHAERAVDALTTYLPAGADKNTKIGFMHVLAGTSLVLVAEHYCNGIPFGSVKDGVLVFEQTPLSVAQVFQRAIVKFDSALLVLPASATSQRYSARVGKARALLNLDQPNPAAAVVAAGGDGAGSGEVPTSFVWNAEFSALSIGNGLYDWIPASGNFTPTYREGLGNAYNENGTGQGLDFIWSLDPRLQIQTPHFRLAQDGSTRIYNVLAYSKRDAPMKAASGVEARLIEAEAALRAGNGSWLTTLNTLRSTAIAPALAALTDAGTEAARVDMFFRERAFWLFLTAHRMGDMRRLIRQYNRTPDSVFPSGQYFKGGVYGTSVVFLPPATERNRPAGAPAYTGCTNLNP